MNLSVRQKIWWTTAGTALAVAAAVTLGAGAREARADPLLDVPFASTLGCTYLCRVCPSPKGDRHDIVVATTSNAQSAHLETCNDGECSSHACDAEQVPAGGAGRAVVRDPRDAGRRPPARAAARASRGRVLQPRARRRPGTGVQRERPGQHPPVGRPGGPAGGVTGGLPSRRRAVATGDHGEDTEENHGSGMFSVTSVSSV